MPRRPNRPRLNFEGEKTQSRSKQADVPAPELPTDDAWRERALAELSRRNRSRKELAKFIGKGYTAVTRALDGTRVNSSVVLPVSMALDVEPPLLAQLHIVLQSVDEERGRRIIERTVANLRDLLELSKK